MTITVEVQLACNSAAFGGHYIADLPGAIEITAYFGSGSYGYINVVEVGATAWTAYSAEGVEVGSGSLHASVTRFPVSTGGNWIGGTAIVPGWYQVVTNNGSSSSAYVLICPGSPSGGGSNLWNIDTTPALSTGLPDLGAWAPGTVDRDAYCIPASTPAEILANVRADPYFANADGVRARHVWISSNDQSSTSPTPAQWAAVATALGGAGYHAVYEIPTNEPENAGMNAAAIISASNAARAAIIAADPQAKLAVYCTAGGAGGFTEFSTVLAGLDFTPDFYSTHMENQIENLADFVALRQYFSGLAAIGAKPWWFTETGMTEAAWGVLSVRRGARQRPLFRLIAEMYGWAKEQCYDFPIFDHGGSGITTYQVEPLDNPPSAIGPKGNIRPGLYALHVMAEALYKTSCPPVQLSFGADGSVGDSLFVGAHYKGTVNDVAVLATNGVAGASVILSVPLYAPGASIIYWDGMGRSSTVTVSSSGGIAIPVDDLLTYVFLTPSSTVSVVDTDQGVVAMGRASDVIPSGVTTNGADVVATILDNDLFTESFSDAPGASTPYEGTTVPDSLTTTGIGYEVASFAMRSMQSGMFGGNTSSPIELSIAINGDTVYTYRNATAVSYPNRPSGDSDNGAARATSTEYWDGAWSWAQQTPPVVAQTVVLTISKTSYGGTIAETPSGSQQINISEWQLYYTPGAGSSASVQGTRLGRG